MDMYNRQDRKDENERIAVGIDRGIISLIEPDGEIGHYAQRGITVMDRKVLNEQIYKGALNSNALMLQELPREIKLKYEVPGMGRAAANYKIV